MLSQAVGDAVRAMMHIARTRQGPTRVREIAAATGIPAPYLAKTVNLLARRGLLSTKRGIRGGVALRRPAGEISLYDLCVALNDPLTTPKCILGRGPCGGEPKCPAHRFVRAISERQVRFLQKTTVEDLLGAHGGARMGRGKR